MRAHTHRDTIRIECGEPPKKVTERRRKKVIYFQFVRSELKLRLVATARKTKLVTAAAAQSQATHCATEACDVGKPMYAHMHTRIHTHSHTAHTVALT